MKPEQLIAEVEALQPSGPDQVVTKFYKWRLLGPLVLDALKSMQAATERLTAERDEAMKRAAAWEIQAQDFRDRVVKAEAERDELRARLSERKEECRELESRRLLAYRAYCDVSRRLDEEERERKEDRARAMARIAELESALATLRAAQTPRPIAEAPKDGTWVLAWTASVGWAVLRHLDSYGGWVLASHPTGTYNPTHFLPLPVTR